ncbi:hypothetical protein [Roseibium sp. RKSG952]|uniref:hypothetical protein n=1 Tax=Roseibium sp. RKSG952 TaxID=2529384 RepID=UPI0012BB4E25|nr:hypothetical protein [Roseibium sp. RKSG952]MTH97919.1 hypothetical protein [Roseibium sp. RKSG952]
MTIQSNNNKSAAILESRGLWFLLGAMIVAAAAGAWIYTERQEASEGLSIEFTTPGGDQKELNVPLPGKGDG